MRSYALYYNDMQIRSAVALYCKDVEGSTMSTIICNECGIEIEITAALQGQIEQQVLDAARKQHSAEMEKVRAEAEAMAKQAEQAARELADKKLAGERELLMEKAKADADIMRQRLEADLESREKRQAMQSELLMKSLKDDAENAKQQSKELREQLNGLMQSLRQEKQARENAELEAQKKISAEQAKLQDEARRRIDEARKSVDEDYKLRFAEQEKKMADMQKSLVEAQRKAEQGSQQLQGEIMELDLEKALAEAWRDDIIAPVPKGVNGADIAHTVRSPRGTECGLILWEIKRTKNWTDGWVPKLKEDVRSAKAAVAIIVTEAMPKQIEEDMGQVQGVWVCRPQLAIVLGALLRDGLLKVGRQKALTENRGEKADLLFSYVTGHEFAHQIQNMVETYQEMTMQVTKERAAYEKIWSMREKQIQTLFMGTANIYGGIQGYLGQASMPKIKGLELLEAGDDDLAGDATSDGAGNLTLV